MTDQGLDLLAELGEALRGCSCHVEYIGRGRKRSGWWVHLAPDGGGCQWVIRAEGRTLEEAISSALEQLGMIVVGRTELP